MCDAYICSWTSFGPARGAEWCDTAVRSAWRCVCLYEIGPLCVWSVNVGVWTGSGLGEGLMYCVCECVSECVDVHVFNGVYIWCMYIFLTILSA